MAKFPGAVGPSGTTASPILDVEETINYILEQPQSRHAENDEGCLLPTPGFTQLASVSQSVSRGFIFAGDSRFLGVIGSKLYEFDVNFTVTDRGNVAGGSEPAQLVYNGIGGQVGICAGGNVYVFTLATNVLSAAILTGGYTHLAFAGSYGFALQTTTGKTFVSAANDLATWSAGTFFQRSQFADPMRAIFTDENNLLWCLGSETFEVRYNGGGTGDQPWVPFTGLVGPYGIASAYGFGLSGAGNFWVTKNKEGVGRFVLSSGGPPKPVGTYAIDAQIDKFAASAAGISDVEVMVYDQGGHTSASVAMAAAQAANPAVPCTFNYDVEGKAWTKRGRWDAQRGRWELWAPRCHVLAFGKHIVGDRSSGSIWLLDKTVSTDIDGSGVRRLRRTPHLSKERLRVPIDKLQLIGDVGVGLASGQGSDPQMMLRLSVDGGYTYGDELQCGIGRLGKYRRECIWTQLGANGDNVFEWSYSDPVPFSLVGAFLNNTEPVRSGRGR